MGTGDDSGFSDFGNPSSFSTSSSSSGPFRNLKSDIKPPESSSSSEDEDDLEAATIKFQKEALDSHNQCREKHGVAPLKIDKKLCSFAQEWANKLAKEDSFEHRTSQEYGENLYCSWSSNPKAKCAGSKPVDSWYSEMTNIHLDPSLQAVLRVILRKWCGKIHRSSALPKLSHQNRVKLLLWQITNRLVTGLDSIKTMCPHRSKATKIFPFYKCMCIDSLWKKNKENPFCRK